MKIETLTARILVAAGLALLLAAPAHAWSTYGNPDKYFSVGMDVSTGKVPGMLKDQPTGAPHTDGGFVKGLLDVRYPISDAVTLHAFGSSTGINNNMQFSDGNEVGIGMRVYFHD